MGCTSSTQAALALPGVAPKVVAQVAHEVGTCEPQQRALGIKSTPSFHDSYILRHKLGSGAFASVYAAMPLAGDIEQAVKVTDLRMHRGTGVFSGASDTKRCQEVWREVEMLQRIQGSKHALGFVDAFMESGLSYVVMDKCDTSLLLALECKPVLNEQSIKGMLRGMLSGIAAIHEVRVVHRDIKPDNFLCVGEQATVKLCDFGFASTVLSDSVESGLKGVYGTPPFMAPEILCGPSYRMPVDVWSFGVIAYTLLLGVFPYMPKEHSSTGMKFAIIRDHPAPTFRPAKYCKSAEVCTSNAATSLLHMLLQRQPFERASAKAALASAFFTAQAEGCEGQKDNLRPMLRSAKHIGLFDLPGQSEETLCDVDIRLAALQEESRIHFADAAVRSNAWNKASAGQAPSEAEESVGSTFASGDSP